MKKVLGLLSIILLVSTLCYADSYETEPIGILNTVSDALDKIPTVKSGIAWSINDSAINHTQTISLVGFGKYVNFDIGYAGSSDDIDHRLVTGISINLIDGGLIDLPVLKYVEFKPQILYGLGDINIQDIGSAKHDILLGAQIIEWKF